MNEQNTPSLHVYQVALETLSPVFIGAGEDAKLSPYTDFVYDRGRIHTLDEKAIAKEFEKQPALIEEFVRGVRLGMDNNRSRFDLKRFLTERLRTPVEKLTAETRTVSDYEGNVLIQRCIATNGKPYIPGSTIKGAIRTAVLWNWLANEVEGQKEKHAMTQLVVRQNYQGLKRHKEQVACFGEIQEDRFKYLHLSDTAEISTEHLNIENRSRFSIKKGGEEIQVFSESIKPAARTSFSLRIAVPGAQAQAGNEPPYFDFLRNASIEQLLDMVNEFSFRNVCREVDILIDNDKRLKGKLRQVLQFYEELQQQLDELDTNEAILRIGAGKTYFDNSIGHMYDETDTKEEELLRQFLHSVLSTKEKPFNVKASTDFPATRSFSTRNKQPHLPFGWIKIKVHKKGSIV